MNDKANYVLEQELQYHKKCIEKIEKILALSESQSVSDNEGKQEFCKYTIDNYNECPIWINNDEMCCGCMFAK